MLGDILGGLIGGVSNIISGNTQRQIAQEYNQAQRELAQYQNEWNLEMWNKQNEYNSPVKQMARYQQAGLNPHLIYGQGSNGNSQNVPKAAAYDIAQVPRIDAGSAFSNALNSALQVANVELINANKEKVQQDSELSKTQRLKLQSDILWQNMNNAYFKDTVGFRTDKERYEADFAKWNSQTARWDMRSKRFNFTTMLPTQYRSLLAGIDKINQEIATSQSQEDLNRTNINYLENKDDREERQLKSQIDVYSATIRNLDAQTQKAYQDTIAQELMNEFNRHLLTPDRARYLNTQESKKIDKLTQEISTAVAERNYTQIKTLVEEVRGYYESLGVGKLPSNFLTDSYIMSVVAATLKGINENFVNESNQILNR